MKLHNLFALLFLAASLQAEDQTVAPSQVKANPRDFALWEAGAVAAGLYLPDYPAAGQKHAKWVVAPYAIYRGRILRADREGARARLVHSRRLDVEMSFAAAFATHSEDNEARRGMPDLDYLVEVGPRASLMLSKLGGRGTLRFNVPLRAVLSTNLRNLKHRGFTLSPALYMHLEPFIRRNWIGVAQLAGRFANRSMNAYFYDVAPEFSTAARPTYDARAGYLGTDLFTGVAIPIGKRFRFFGGGQLYMHEGSANSASPLFRKSFDYSVGCGLGYIILQSKSPAHL